MEIFLLLLDELDDAVAMLREQCSRLLGFFIACGLFSLSVMAAMHWPMLAALLVIAAVVWALLPATGMKLPRFKTDP